jgi:FlaA1/EpsC-like NDP-sugar epimerase
MTFAGKSVLVTGAGGSIGSQICERVIADGAKRLTMVSLTESGLYNIDRHLRRLGGDTKLIPILGSVGNECLMLQVLQGADIVVHAAAHKHVPLCQQNQIEAIRNNIFGTETLALAARKVGVEQFCMVSTDKAVQPASIMGATKRVAELVISRMGGGFFTVRFGNVLDSAGSVLPLWREQIRAGGPLTLTDERCERYFMSIPQAVGLISSVLDMKPAGGTFVLDMGQPRLMIDVARELMREVGQTVDIQCIGLRPGEKLTEELHYGGEVSPTAVPGVLQVTENNSHETLSLLNELDKASRDCDKVRAVQLLWAMLGC